MQYHLFPITAGEVKDINDRQTFADCESALRALVNVKNEGVLLCADVFANSMPVTIPADFERYDLVHAGLDGIKADCFQSLLFTSTNWLFLDPKKDHTCTSWKARPALTWMRPHLIRRVGGWDAAYLSPTSRLMDLSYRILMAGGRVCHYSGWQSHSEQIPSADEVPLTDEFIFLTRHLGQKAASYAANWHALCSGASLEVLRALRIAQERSKAHPAPLAEAVTDKDFHLIKNNIIQKVGRITAIIPTINRYEYLPKAIESLLKQNPIPEEIIVVDQTPAPQRKPEIYRQYGERVRVIYLDQAGQSIARNTALEAARGEWCLLFEDDTAAWETMLESLVYVAEHSGADAVSGLTLAPWKTVENIPVSIRHYRLSDVLATGICLVRKQALLEIGGLDRAFDHGSGADHDLGAQLYLNGNEIIFNPHAIATHYKATTGGMRTFSAWWRNYAGIWSAYPQPTQSYIIQKYYSARYHLPLYLLSFFNARKQMKLFEYIWLWLTMPWKLIGSLMLSKRLRTKLLLKENAIK